MRAVSNWLDVWSRFSPNREAVYDLGTGRRWTYAQLRDEANAWAALLRERDVCRGDRVAVLAENRGETLALLFAVADIGAVLFPMNWRLADAELNWQCGHASPKVVFCDDRHAGRLEGAEPLTTPAPAAAVKPVSLHMSDPWVLMYTSGSSGRPKGAMLTHQQLHWNAVNTTLACNLTADDATLTFAPLFHTGGLNCLTTPLLHRGGRVVLTPRLDVAESLATIAREGITLLMGVPTIYQMMADHEDFETTDLTRVRDALCGGAALPNALLERYAARNIPLRQGFGLTEVGPNCFSLPPTHIRSKAGTVGLPIHHVAAKLVRDDGSECDVGEPGELWLKGPVVCGGYWNDPEATAKSITNGWFHTGDVLTRDADGFFTVSGRKKEMFISGGENVYPAEVEAVIADCPGVALAAVVGIPDVRWGEVGVAYIEGRPGAELGTDAIRGFLAGRLAKFKQPKRIEVVAMLPRTGSGKIDKPALIRRAVGAS